MYISSFLCYIILENIVEGFIVIVTSMSSNKLVMIVISRLFSKGSIKIGIIVFILYKEWCNKRKDTKITLYIMR